MPEARLVLPRGIAGADDFRAPGSVHADLTGPVTDLPVVFVIPSLPHVLQAAWIAAIGSRTWVPFETWLADAVEETADGSARPTWRYDAVVRAWAEAVGADRIHVVVGDDAHAAAAALASIVSPPTSGSFDPWPRALSWPEVRMADALVAELEELGLVGHNAAEMVHGGLRRLVLDGADVPLGTSPLASPLADRVAQRATEMRTGLESSGVNVVGDRSALTRLESADDDANVGLQQAGRLAAGVLEHVATWGQRSDA